MADFFKDSEEIGEQDEDIVTLYNEARDCDEEFYHLATLDLEDKWFIVLKPVEKLPDIADDEVLIFQIEEDKDGNDVFLPIEDEKLLDRVFAEFDKEMCKFAEEHGIGND